MSTTIGVLIPDSTGGHYELFESITTDLDAALRTPGMQAFPWGLQSFGASAGTAGPIGAPYHVTQFQGGWLLNGCPLNVIFGAGWLPGQQDALSASGITCNNNTPITNAQVSPASIIPPNVGTTRQGSLTNLSPISGSTIVDSNTAIAVAPQLTPGSTGSLPNGSVVGQTAARFTLTRIYRFIVASAPGRYDTGANYPGCSQVNTAICDPQQFTTLQAALNYAASKGETPYIASSAAEVWAIISGSAPIDNSKVGSGNGSSTLLLVAAGLAAIFLLRR